MIVPLKNGLYETESESTDRTYVMDPRRVTCTCPDWTNRRMEKDEADPERRCKHLRKLEKYLSVLTPLGRAADKVFWLNEDRLLALAHKHNGTVAGAACWLELAARRING